MPDPSRRQLLALWALAGLGATVASAAQGVPTVAAASDLKFALEELAAIFERDTGTRLRLVFGSSGNFTAQLLQDAPFDLFLSADEDYVFRLADAGRTRDRGRLYAQGRICIVAPLDSPLQVDPELRDLKRALDDGRVRRFAIANPEHAPYGRRAEEALRRVGAWQAIQPRLVLGENISQAAQFASSGGAQGGIIALSLALAPAVSRLVRQAPIPDTWHQPLRQRMVLLKRAAPGAEAFYAWLQTPAVRAVLARHGFVAPQE